MITGALGASGHVIMECKGACQCGIRKAAVVFPQGDKSASPIDIAIIITCYRTGEEN